MNSLSGKHLLANAEARVVSISQSPEGNERGQPNWLFL